MQFSSSGPNRRVVLSGLAALTTVPLLSSASAQAQTAAAPTPAQPGGFSFAVYGDSRSMMYLPYKSDQETDARQLMVEMFDLVLPEKVSEEVVKKYVKLTYDPASHELVQIVMPFIPKRSHHPDPGQRLGHRSLGRGRKAVSGRAPHDVPAARRRVGCPRGCERRKKRAGQVHC